MNEINYLRIYKQTKSYSDNSILKLLRNKTEIDKITINIMRSIYVNFYKHNINYNDKQNLARQMRHSPETAAIHYNKISQNTNNSENCDVIISDLNSQIYELKKQIEILKLNNNDNIDDKLFQFYFVIILK